MQKLLSGVGILLFQFVLGASADAAIVIHSDLNTDSGSFSGTTGFREVTFDLADFPADPTILDIEVTINFTKLAPLNSSPLYNGIQFSLSAPSVPELSTTLIRSGTPTFPVSGTFAQGDFGDAGFDGTLVFRHSATLPVNTNPDVIPDDGQPYLPDGDFSGFIGQSGAQTFRLTITDSSGNPDASLVFNSFQVSVTAVPEPGSLACLGLLATAGMLVRRRRV